MEEALQRLRDQIDALDSELLRLLNERAKVAIAVGDLKKQRQAEVYRPDREAEVLNRLSDQNPGPLAESSVRVIFKEVMSACRGLERIPAVAFLGPSGTYSERAVYEQFGRSVQPVACATIDEVFRQAEVGAVDFAMVPVGGMRASIYNAMPIEGVQQLVEFMREFEKAH